MLDGYATQEDCKFDDMALFYSKALSVTLSAETLAGQKGSKKRVAFTVPTSGDGSEKLPPLRFGFSMQPRCFEKQLPSLLGVQYVSSR